MFEFLCLLINVFLLVLMGWMGVTTALLWRISRKMPRQPSQKQVIPTIGDEPEVTAEPAPIPATPLDLDTAFEELWTVLQETGVVVTQDWFIQAWFGNDGYHSIKCSDGAMLVWYGKMPEPARLYQQEDQKKRKAAKQQQKAS